MPEAFNSLFKAELVRNGGPWHGIGALELATAGVDRRSALKDRSFRPVPLRERMIPQPGGKQRRLGIATINDRAVQASLKLVLEPIFEADS